MSSPDRTIRSTPHSTCQEVDLPQLAPTGHDLRRGGEIGSTFYRELAEETEKEDRAFRLPPPIGARRAAGVWPRMQRILYIIFAP